MKAMHSEFATKLPRSVLLAAALLLTGAWSTLAGAESTACVAGEGFGVWTSPRQPVRGEPLRLFVVAETEAGFEARIRGPQGNVEAPLWRRYGGPPFSVETSIESPREGTYRIEVYRGGAGVGCQTVSVRSAPPRDLAVPSAARLRWGAGTEAFYSAWVEKLFDAPVGEDLAFSSLQEVLRDPQRNFLHDYLQLGEDDAGSRNALAATPDCADLPYFLRAYFAWKIGLPFGLRSCSRGGGNAAPRCGAVRLHEVPGAGPSPLAAFRAYTRELMDAVHSGNARTALADEATDFYPVALRREALRPGTIYADPYGHTLMIAKWIDQIPGRGGLLLAVDAQPDNSVARKRFWEGTFLFGDPSANPGAGFKAFRPIVREGGGRLRPLGNQELARGGEFAPFSDELAEVSADEFYARMSRLLQPLGLDPLSAYDDTLAALMEQLRARVGSVDNGERYLRSHPGVVVPMPEGGKIFETVGAWEDYATPSRDMRLLIAMRVLLELPRRIVHHPELYRLQGSEPRLAVTEVEARHARRAGEESLAYTRSDGSLWTLSVAEILQRRAAFEMAYNPNDCVETRWGAQPGSPEHATCRRQAPAEQRARMASYRPWFHETRRPPR